MKTKITATEEIIDDEEVTVWRIDKGNGTIVINLNMVFDNSIYECDWLDNNHEFIQVMYSDWNDNDLFAIVSAEGKIIRDGIRGVEEVLEEQKLFIVEMSGLGMGDEAVEYNLDADDWKMAVINRHGEFVIPPVYIKIWFEDTENIFYADNYTGIEHKFSLVGRRI